MKKYFERMRGHEKFTTSSEISCGPPPSINNGCSLRIHILSCTVKESLHFLVAFTLSYALMSYMLQRSYYTL